MKSAGDPYNVEALQKEEEFYEAALALVHSLTVTRASLIQCRILLGKLSEASLLLMQSLNYSGFLAALHHENKNRGYLGHQILRQLPESEWLYHFSSPSGRPPTTGRGSTTAWPELTTHERKTI